MTVTWESIKEGDTLPELKKTPGVTQLVKYAAGGGDFNPMHHDYNFFQSKAMTLIFPLLAIETNKAVFLLKCSI